MIEIVIAVIAFFGAVYFLGMGTYDLRSGIYARGLSNMAVGTLSIILMASKVVAILGA